MTVLALTIGRYGSNNYNDTITTLMQGREKKKTIFRLTPTTIQHNVDAGMRDSRLIPTTATTTHGKIGAGGP